MELSISMGYCPLSFKKTSDNAIVKREILNLEKCLCDISVWMSQNKLKLNNDKTEIILFGSYEHGTPCQKCCQKI